jgi:hypothetical protein
MTGRPPTGSLRKQDVPIRVWDGYSSRGGKAIWLSTLN